MSELRVTTRGYAVLAVEVVGLAEATAAAAAYPGALVVPPGALKGRVFYETSENGGTAKSDGAGGYAVGGPEEGPTMASGLGETRTEGAAPLWQRMADADRAVLVAARAWAARFRGKVGGAHLLRFELALDEAVALLEELEAEARALEAGAVDAGR